MSSETTITEETVLKNYEKLSKKRRQEAAGFIAYLKALEEIEATREIINDEGFLEAIMRGDEDFKKGRFKKWSEVREDV